MGLHYCGGVAEEHIHTHIGEKPQSERERRCCGGMATARGASLSSHYFIYRSRHVYIWVAPDNNKSLLSLRLCAQKMTRRVQLYAHSSSLSAYGSSFIPHRICVPPKCRERQESRSAKATPLNARPASPSLSLSQ
jgi:hypothetical protein